MKLLSNEEVDLLHSKAEAIALSMSDYLRKRAGFEPIRRRVGRPPQTVVECPRCKATVGASGFAKHTKAHFAEDRKKKRKP
jgi:hypothetical protein